MKKLLLLSALLMPLMLPAAEPTGEAYTFRVEIDGIDPGSLSFSSAGEISGEIEVIEYQDGSDTILRKRPGRTKYGNITLKRGYTANNDLFQWWQETATGRIERKSMSIILMNREGADAATFSFTQCWPTKWKLSGFGETLTNILTEEMTIVTEGMSFGN